MLVGTIFPNQLLNDIIRLISLDYNYMKQLTCAQMGGPCDAPIMGNDMNEMAENGMKHLQEVHPEMAADMAKMSPEDNAKWMADMQPKFDTAPTM